MGSTTAFDTRYEVSTHVPSSVVAERFPAMCGSATLAMEESSASINVARVTVIAISQGFARGFHVSWKDSGEFAADSSALMVVEAKQNLERKGSAPVSSSSGVKFFYT